METYAAGRHSSILEAMRTIATALLICGLALAQGPGGGGGGGGRGGGGGGMGEGGGMRGPMSPAERERMMFDMVCDQLDLKKDQKKQFKGILDKGKETVLPFHQDSNKARALIRNAVKGGTDATPLFQAFGAIQAELVAAEAKIYGEALAMLNDGQKKKADTLYSMIPQLTAPARPGR